MTARAGITFAPRLLGQDEAARYLAISATTLRSLGIPRRVLGARRLYDRIDLDRFAADLPYEGQESEEDACDRHFGLNR
jgi:hypothetical protein